MKKLLSALGVIAITASSSSVASCSLVNNTKQYIKNKVSNLTQISSTLLRSAMIQNATQDLNRGLPLDNDYLSSLILGTSAIDLMPKFNTSPQTTMNSLKDSYFPGQAFDKATINTLSASEDFLVDKTKSPNGPLDSIGGLLTLAISAINSSGGINSSLVGTIEGALPLFANESLAETLNPDTLEPIAKILENNSDMFSEIISELADSHITYSLIANLLNINFINALKEFDFNTIFKYIVLFFQDIETEALYSLLDTMGNSILTMDNIENLTNKQIMNSVVIRINNVLARLANQNDKVITDDLYKDPDYEFAQSFGEVAGEFLKNINNISISNIFPSIIDILYIILGLMQRVSSVDFSSYQPQNSSNLFDSEKNNAEFLTTLGEQKFTTFDSKQALENIIIATSTKNNEEGYQFEKLLSLIFFSGGEVVEIKKPLTGWNIITLFSLFGKLTDDKGGWQGLSPIIYGLGYGIAKWQSIEFGNMGPDQIGNLLSSSLFGALAENKNLSGIPSLLRELPKILESLGVELNLPISLSDESAKELENAFSAIWDKDTHVLGEILGALLPSLGDLSNLSLFSLFSNEVYNGMTISELLNWLLNTSNSYAVINKNKEIDLLSTGLQTLGKSLYDKRYVIYNGNEIWKPEIEGFSALQALIYCTINPGLSIKVEGEETINSSLKGTKAGMQAIGVVYNENGSAQTAFRQDSLLQGLNIVFDQKEITILMDDILNGFKKTTDIKNEVINTQFRPYIKDENFKTDVVSYYGIDSATEEAGITYITTFTDPITKQKFEYQVILKLPENEKDWKISSIQRK